jgi:hypothetical protein
MNSPGVLPRLRLVLKSRQKQLFSPDFTPPELRIEQRHAARTQCSTSDYKVSAVPLLQRLCIAESQMGIRVETQEPDPDNKRLVHFKPRGFGSIQCSTTSLVWAQRGEQETF